MSNKKYITLVSGRCGSGSGDKQAKMLIKRIEEDWTGRASCSLCNKAIKAGYLRLVVKNGRYDYRVHLDCWKLEPIIEPTIFPGYAQLNKDKQQLVQDYCDKINGSVLGKRKAEDHDPNERSSKKICLESEMDEKVWDYEAECPIKSLPSEIFDNMFNYMDEKSVLRLAFSCKKIFVLGTAEDKWQHMVESKWSHLLHMKVDSGQLWISFYRALRDYTCLHCLKPTPHHFPPVNGKLCEKCRGLPQYQTIPKTWAKQKYRLSDKDMQHLKYFKTNTCHGYLVTEVQALALSLGKITEDDVALKKLE